MPFPYFRRQRTRNRPIDAPVRLLLEKLERREMLAGNPFVTSAVLATADPNNAPQVDYRITFNEPVTGVDASDFQLDRIGDVQGTVNKITKVGDGASYLVSVTGVRGDGTLRLGLIDNGSIRDLSNNRLVSNSSVAFDGPTRPDTQPGFFNSPKQVVTGDFNLDGRLDLAATVPPNNIVSVFTNTGGGAFGEGSRTLGGAQPFGVAVADLNGDGKPDLLVCNSYNDSGFANDVSVLIGNGDGTFQFKVRYPVGAVPKSLATGDFNGDGKIDVVAVNSLDETVSILLGNGDGTLGTQTVLPAGAGASNVVVGDVNNDGKLDLAVAATQSDAIDLYFGNGNGTFLPRQSVAVLDAPRTVTLADVTNDGKLDLIVAHDEFGGIRVLKGQGNGSFTNPWDTFTYFDPSLSYTTAVQAIDVNRDGKRDLVIASGWGTRVQLGHGDGTFRNPILMGGEAVSSVAVGDFNGDGDLDIAATEEQNEKVAVFLQQPVLDGSVTFPDTIIQQVAPTVSITRLSPSASLIGPPPGGSVSFAVKFSEPVTGVTAARFSLVRSGVTVGNNPITVTGSGADYVVTISTISGGGQIGISLNSRSIIDATGNPVSSSTPPQTHTVGANPQAIVAADVTGDGKIDVFTADTQDGTISVLRSDASGSTFLARQSYPAGDEPSSLVLADVNGDGRPDVLVRNGYYSASVLVANGSGGFQSPINVPLEYPYTPINFAAGDLTGDGKADLVVRNFDFNVLDLLPGNGNGTFQAPIPLSDFGYNLGRPVIADLNNDGKNDLIAMDSENDSNISVALGNGNGTFRPTLTTPRTIFVNSVVVRDLTGDGKADIAITGSSWGANVNILVGNGNGTFQPAIELFHSAQLSNLAAGDFNDDGRIDLAAREYFDVEGEIVPRGIRIFDNLGAGQFAAGRSIAIARGLGGVAAADFNGDGFGDVAAALPDDGVVRRYDLAPPIIAGPQYTIAASPTTTTITAAPIVYGHNAVFSVTVRSGASPVSGGMVTISVGGTVLAANVALSAAGTAIITVASKALVVGTHIITATYSGTATIPGGSGVLSSFNVKPRKIYIAGNGSKQYDGTTTNPAAPLIDVAGVYEPLAFDEKVVDFFTQAFPSPYPNPQFGEPYEFTPTWKAGVPRNYDVTFSFGYGIIIPRDMTLSAVALSSKTYDGGVTSSTIPTAAGLAPGDSMLNLAQVYTDANVGASKTLSISGGYSVQYGAVSAAAPDKSRLYRFVTSTATGSITAKPLTVNVNAASSVYGSALPVFSATYTGLVAGQSTANLPTLPTFATTATPLSTVGNYAITASGGNGGNYTYSFQPGTLTIRPATLTVSTEQKSYTKEYGASLPTFTPAYSGFVGGQTASVLTSPATISTTATAASPVGQYSLVPAGAAAANYVMSYVASTLVVAQKTVTVTPNSVAGAFGQPLPAFTASYVGFLPGDSAAVLTQQPTFTTAAAPTSTPGKYPIVASGAAASNYRFQYVAGTFTLLSPANLQLSASTVSPVAGVPVSITVTMLDANGNRDMAFNGVVRFTSTDPHTSADRPGQLTLTAGVGTTSATFATAGSQTLSVIDRDGFSQSGSIDVSVRAAAPSRLSFSQQPTPVSANASFSLPVGVAVLDAFGNTTDLSAPVQLAVASGPGAITGGSTATVNAIQGIATFTNVALSASGVYRLRATSSGLTNALSASFDVGAQSNDVVASGLTFRSYAGPFSVSGNIRSVTGEVFVGYSPAPGQPFVPFTSLKGTVTVNTSTLAFSATGQVSAIISGSSIELLDSIPTASIATLTGSGLNVAGGKSVQVAGVTFTLNSIKFANPTGGPEVQLQGSVALPVGVTALVNGGNFVRVNKTGVRLTGVAASVTGSASVGGVSFSVNQLTVGFTPSTSTFTITGDASATISGIANLGVRFGGGTTGGLVIVNGAVKSLGMTVTSTFTVSGVGFTSGTDLKMTYDTAAAKYAMTGTATAAITGLGSLSVTFGGTGLVLTDGSLTSLRMTTTSSVTVANVGLSLSGVDLSYAGGSFTLSAGTVTASIAGVTGLTGTFGIGATPGLVVTGGALTSLAISVSSSFTVGGVAFQAKSLGLQYTASTNTYALSGGANVSIGGISSFSVGFGQGSNPGLVVVGGALRRLAMTVDSQFTVAGTTVNASGLAFNYDAVAGTFSAAGDASVSFRGMSPVAVTFGFGSGVGAVPGLVITAGSLTSLDWTINSSMQVASVSVATNGLRLSYAAATQNFSVAGSASITIGGMTSASGGSSFAVTFAAADGLVVNNGSLTSLKMTVAGGFKVGGVGLNTTNALIHYAAGTSDSGTFTISGSATSTIPGFGNVNVSFGSGSNPGVVVTNGSLKSLDLGASLSNVTLGGVTVSGSGLRFSYNSSSAVYAMSGGVTLSGAAFSQPISATFGYGTRPGIVLTNGSLTSFAVTATGTFGALGQTFSADNLGIAYTSSTTTFEFSGSAKLTISGMGTFGISLGSSTSPGMVLAGGAFTRFDVGITSNFSVAGMTFTSNNLRLVRENGDFKMTGSAGASVSRVANLTVNFVNQGLVITNGRLQSMDMTITSAFKVFGVTIATNNLALKYDALYQQFTIDSGSVTVSTPANGLGSLNLAATFGTTASGGQKGLVISQGAVTELHLKLSGSFAVSGLSFQANNLTLDYTNSTNQLDISGSAQLSFASFVITATVPTNGLSINLDTGTLKLSAFYVAFNLTLGTGYEFSGSLFVSASVYSASGKITIPKIGQVTAGFTITGSGALSEIRVGYNAGSTKGLVVPGTGALYVTSLSGKLTNLDQPVSEWIVSAQASFRYGPSISVAGGTYDFFTADASVTISSTRINGSFSFEVAEGYLGSGTGTLDLDFVKGKYSAQLDGRVSTYYIDVSFYVGFLIKSNGAMYFLGEVGIETTDRLPWPLGDRTLAGAGGYFQRVPGGATLIAGWYDFGVLGIAGAEIGFDGSGLNANFLIHTAEVEGYRARFRSALSDGPIAGAVVFADANDNGRLDDDETALITDAGGNFNALVFTNPAARLVALGGVDISTGLPNSAVYVAPAGSKQINPLTTLVSTLMDQGATLEDAKGLVALAMGLPTTIDVTWDGLVSAALGGDVAAAGTYAAQIRLATVASMTAAAFDSGATPLDLPARTLRVYEALAARLLQAPGVVDLSDPATIRGLLDETASISGSTLDVDVATGAATIIAAVSEAMEDVPVAGSQAYLESIVRIQIVGQSEIAQEFSQATADTIVAVVAGATGLALDDRIAAVASIGVHQAPGISVRDDAHLVGGDGTTTTFTFVVERDSTVSPLESVSIDYETVDGTATATAGDYTASSGTLTWAPGETGSKSVTVTVAGGAANPAKVFYLEIKNPAHAVIADAWASGTIVFDTVTTTTTTLDRVALNPDDTGAASTQARKSAGFVATVRDASGQIVPGFVGFYVGADLLGLTSIDPATGTAALSSASLKPGTHDVRAVYLGVQDSGGADLIAGSASSTFSQNVATASQEILFEPLAGAAFGDGPVFLSASASSDLPVSYRVVSGPGVVVGDELTIIGSGDVVVEATQIGNDTFNAAVPVRRTLHVSAAVLTFTVNDQSIVYGGSVPDLTGQFSGFVGIDTADDLGFSPTITAAFYTGAAAAYSLDAVGPTFVGNYQIVYVSGTLTVHRASLTIVADDQVMTYGGSPNFTATYFGFVNGDTEAVLNATPTFDADTTAGVGEQTIHAAGADADNYEITYVSGTLAIVPATVIVTPVAVSKAYGQPMPALAASYSGFVHGETPLVLTVAPTLTTAAQDDSEVGEYVVDFAGAEAANYLFVYESNVVTVAPATLEIIAGNLHATYGGALPEPIVGYFGFVNGDTVDSLLRLPTVTTAPAGSGVGSYAIEVAGALSSNYSLHFVAGTLTIAPAPLTVTATTTFAAVGATPTLTAVYEGFVGSEGPASLNSPPSLSASAAAVGIHPINVSGASSPNYAITHTTGVLVVTPAPIAIEHIASNSSVDVTPTPIDGITYAIASGPLHGTLSNFEPATGRVTYTPFEGYAGSDGFTFTMTYTDADPGRSATSPPIAVSLSIDAPPAPVDQVYVDDDWIGMTAGATIADADPAAAGDQAAVFGVNAFAAPNAAIAAAGVRVSVNAGVYNQAVALSRPLSLRVQQGAVTFGSLSAVGDATITLDSLLTVGGDGASTQVAAAIDGPGGLIKTGAGTLTLTGSAANSYTGTTTVLNGTLALAKTGGGDKAIHGPVVIGGAGGAGGLQTAILRIDASEQIASTAGVIVEFAGSDGQFFVAAGTETILPIKTPFQGGDVRIAGTLITDGIYTQAGGTTTLAGGTLRSGTTSNLDVTLSSGTLQGNGFIYANIVNNNATATIDPGIGNASAGTITIFGNLFLNSGGALNLNVGATAATTDLVYVRYNTAVAGPAPVQIGSEPLPAANINATTGRVKFGGTLNVRRTNGAPIANGLIATSMIFDWRLLDDVSPQLTRTPTDFETKNLGEDVIGAATFRYDPRFQGTTGQFNAQSHRVSMSGVLAQPPANLGPARYLRMGALTNAKTGADAAMAYDMSPQASAKMTSSTWTAGHTLVTVTINNNGPTITGPIYLEVNSSQTPTANKVFNKAGYTRSSPGNIPYLLASTNNLATGQSITVVVDLLSSVAIKPALTMRVMAGGLP